MKVTQSSIIEAFPDSSRIWVYQSIRQIAMEDRKEILGRFRFFGESWTSHGRPMVSTCDIILDHFILLAVHEESLPISGCGIDKSVSVLRDIENDMGYDFSDRQTIPYLENGELRWLHFAEVEKAITEGRLSINTLVLDHIVDTVGKWKSGWMVPLERTWLARFATV